MLWYESGLLLLNTEMFLVRNCSVNNYTHGHCRKVLHHKLSPILLNKCVPLLCTLLKSSCTFGFAFQAPRRLLVSLPPPSLVPEWAVRVSVCASGGRGGREQIVYFWYLKNSFYFNPVKTLVFTFSSASLSMYTCFCWSSPSSYSQFSVSSSFRLKASRSWKIASARVTNKGKML